MKLDIGNGVLATLGNLVGDLTGVVAAVGRTEPRQIANGTIPARTEVAIDMPTGSFVAEIGGEEGVQALAQLMMLKGQTVLFTCEIANDSYGKAKQPRVYILAFKPVRTPPDVTTK